MEIRANAVTKSSVVVALVLSLVVGTIFFVLQNYGPESTIRKFHSAIQRGLSVAGAGNQSLTKSLRDIQREVIEPLGLVNGSQGDPAGVSILRFAVNQMQNGGKLQILRMDRYPREVRAVVAYYYPNRPPQEMIWVVEKPTGRRAWLINATKTLRAVQ
jgi:hypothetical protein